MLKAKSSQLSFYGNHIYDRVIPKDHFLKLLNKAVDFSFVNELCRDAYTPDFGRPAYGPEMKDNPAASPDKDARHGYKSEKKPFFGYKARASMDSDSELITKLETTPGNVNDGQEFLKVVDSKSKMTIQFTMTAIAGDLKRIVKLLFHQGCLGTSKPGSFHQGIPVPILP